jgi:MSHA pilin protein MshA
MGRSGGFTLLELIVVITIISILAAVAAPRYVALQRDARAAKAQAFYGSIMAASVLAKARCELDLSGTVGSCTTTGGTVNMDGTNVSMKNRYPAATSSGIDAAAQLSAGEGLTISGGGDAARIYEINGADDGSTCRISYSAAPSVGVAPTINVLTTGC